MKLKAIVFICGAVVMALEMLGSRILAPFYGNSLFAWGSLIGVILGSLSFGYYLGGKRADSHANHYGLSMIILRGGFFTLLIPFLSQIIFDPGLVSVMGLKYGSLFSVILLFTVPSVYLGMVSPYAVKLEAKRIANLGTTAGNLYAISTVGSIFGTFFTAFFLIPEMGVRSITYGLGLILMLTSVVLGGRSILPKALFYSVLLAAVFLVGSSYGFAEPGKLVYKKDSAYYEIKIVDYPEMPARFMYLDGTLTGAMYLNSSKAVFRYTDYFHLPFTVNPEIKDVLFLGGGAGTGPKRFYESYPGVRMDVVDIDPEVNAAAHDFFGLRQNDRTFIYSEEGRFFLARTDKKYDLIVVDAFNSISSVPNHLMTVEFLENAKKHLSENGMILLNMHTSVRGKKSRLFGAEYATYKQVFPSVYVFPVGGDPQVVQNVILLATKAESEYSKEDYIRGSEKVSADTGIAEMKEYSGHLMTEEISYSGRVLSDDYCPADFLLLQVLDG